MNVPRYVGCAIAGFAFTFIFDFLFHGQFLMSTYEQTPELWRSQESMQEFFPVMMMCQFLFAAAFAYIFTLNYEGKGLGEGVRFGLPMGVLIGIGQFTTYAYMPISLNLALMWFGGAVIWVIGLGVIFASIYKQKETA